MNSLRKDKTVEETAKNIGLAAPQTCLAEVQWTLARFLQVDESVDELSKSPLVEVHPGVDEAKVCNECFITVSMGFYRVMGEG